MVKRSRSEDEEEKQELFQQQQLHNQHQHLQQLQQHQQQFLQHQGQQQQQQYLNHHHQHSLVELEYPQGVKIEINDSNSEEGATPQDNQSALGTASDFVKKLHK